jgi:2'-5' RNA ligase
MPEAIRSFIAFDIESVQGLEKITEMQKKLAGTGADLKFVEPKNIHIISRATLTTTDLPAPGHTSQAHN